MRGATFLSVLHALSIRNFNPRSSCEERHGKTSLLWQMAKISIHAPHARSDDAGEAGTDDHKISIHAPHARSDDPWIDALVSWTKISIHAPHARSDDILDTFGALEDTFQSTLLMRGATCRGGNDAGCEHDFNPRSSCEERLCRRHAGTAGSDFNPRSSCEERLIGRWCNERCLHFNPRSSCEERRQPAAMSCVARHFNPRSSCEERPSGVRGVSWSQANFNPRSSCEERHAEIPMRG